MRTPGPPTPQTEEKKTLTPLAWDTETGLFGQGNMAPPLVCVSFAKGTGESGVVHSKDPLCLSLLKQWLSDTTTLLIGQNIAYDMAVVCAKWPELTPLVFQAYDQDRVTDTQIREKLTKIALGTITEGDKFISLATLAKQYEYPIDLDKDTWRLRYMELMEVPVAKWPKGAVDYSLHDALSTLWVYESQDFFKALLEDQFRQTRAAFALHLCSVWGIATDEWQVERMARYTQERLDEARDTLVAQGWLYQDKRGEWHKRAKEVKTWVKTRYPDIKKTPTGEPSLDADTVGQLGDPLLECYSLWGNATTAMGHAEELAPPVVHCRFDSLKATGRTGSEKPNIQNRATKPGDRECFEPRPGNCYLNMDFPGLELRTVAQVLLLLGIKSRLAEVLNDPSGDPHAMVAATLLGIELEEALQRKQNPEDNEFYLARQTGKIANFGLAGGMGAAAFVAQARAQYGVVISLQEAKGKIIPAWLQTWPEFPEYFKWVKTQTQGGTGTAKQLLSNRFRGNLTYTVFANTMFQGLGADVAKAGLWAIQKACYSDRKSPLFGSRLVNFIHDEYLLETRVDGSLTEKAQALESLVFEACKPWLPDVPPLGLKATATMRWSKLSKRVVDSNNLLQVWTGELKKPPVCGGPGEGNKPCPGEVKFIHRLDQPRPRVWSEFRCSKHALGPDLGRKWVRYEWSL